MKYAARILIPVLVSLGLQSGTVIQGISAMDAVEPFPSALASAHVAEIGELPVATRSPEMVTAVTGGTDKQKELVAWALEQYERAGLELPVLQFHLHSDESACRGNSGLFGSGPIPWKITLCTDERMVFLHETGHAWSEHTLADSERAEYVEQRGMESWNDNETPWRARGSEDAANTLAWGLVDDPIRGMTPDGPLAQKNSAFRLLTGMDSPRITE